MAFLDRFTSLDSQRKRLLKKAKPGPAQDFLSHPFPDLTTPIKELQVLAVDFETTGLNPLQDKLLSVGMVEMHQLKIPLKTAYHQIIRTEEALKAENVIIHQITDDAKDAGEALKEVVEKLLEHLTGKVMLAHYHPIEREFLKRACELLYETTIAFPMIDTLHLQKKEWDKGLLPYDPSNLRLSNLRDHYHLPPHKAHNALTDALATAELFQAQCSTYQYTTAADVQLDK